MTSIIPLGRRKRANLFRDRASRMSFQASAPDILTKLIDAGDARYDPRRAARQCESGAGVQTFKSLLAESDSVPPHSEDAGGLAPAASQMPRWSYVPLSMPQSLSPLQFHHFLHGRAGRGNERRRPLVVQAAIMRPDAIATLVEERLRRFRASHRDAQFSGFVDLSTARGQPPGPGPSGIPVADSVVWGGPIHRTPQPAVGRPESTSACEWMPWPPFAPTSPTQVEATVTDRLLRQLVHEEDEGMVSVAAPALLRIHQPPHAVQDAMRLEAARGVVGDPSDRAARLARLDRLRFADITLNPGDVAYIPRGIVYDIVQPSLSMATGTPSSRLRKPGLLPTDMLVAPAPPRALTLASLTASAQIRLADADDAALGDGRGEAARVPLVAWRWRFRRFPDFTDRIRHPEPYVAAACMSGSLEHLYASRS
jgi:hypothetical protein